MGKKEIYIVRHGQTDYNKIGKSQGRGIDSSLNDTGRAQAASFFEAYKSTGFQKLYLSSLRRTEESMQHFIQTGIALEKLTGLDEISFGEREGLFFKEDDFDYYQIITEEWSAGNLDYKFSGGESPLEVVERQKEAIRYILDQPEDKVLICMHGRAMRILMSWILGKELKDMDVFKHNNLGLYILTYENERFELKVKNDIAHLDSIVEI